MKITALRLHNVKRFAGRGVAIENIGDGVNVLCAVNEFGKSTSFEALHALFFQAHTGTPEAVRQLRPYSGGNPLVEADITTSEGRYRLTKQFYGGKRAAVTDLSSQRLVAQADEAEAFIANLIRGGTAGPGGLLWVRQGVTGIEKRSKSEEEGEKRVRESLLSSVQGEVEALTGGRRMAEIADACSEELFRYVTPTLKPKAGSLYDQALEEQRRLAEKERQLGVEVDALRDALEKRGAALKRLAELEDPDEAAERLLAVEKAQASFDAAKARAGLLKTAEAEAALARNRRDAAQSSLVEFQTAHAQAVKLRADADAAGQKRQHALEQRDAAAASIDAAMAAVKAAEAEEREARELLSRLDAALAARKAAEELGEMRGVLEQVETLRAGIEAQEAALALLTLPTDAVERLQKLEIELVRLRAAKDATLPTVRLAYAQGAEGSVAMDGVVLQHDAEQVFAETAQLTIAGVGTLTLRSNRPATTDDALHKAEETHRKLLTSLGVESLDAARQRQAATRDKSTELALSRQQLTHLAPQGLASLRENIARLEALCGTALEFKADADQVRQQAASANQKVKDTFNAAREAQPARDRAADAVVAAETTYATLAAELARLDALLGPAEHRTAREEKLAADHAAAQARFLEAESGVAALRSGAQDLGAAEAILRRTRSVQEAAQQEIAKLRETLAELNSHIRTRSDDAVEEVWRETSEARAAADQRVRHYRTEVEVLDRLRKALQSARSAAKDLYLKPVISELRPLLGLLFDDISIVFDEETLLPQTIRRNGQDEDVDRLSGGMREQLSVLTRLAFARLLAQNGRPAPVILDDALVYSDDDRIERMFNVLHHQSRDQQILVFSCRQRAFAKLGGNILQMTDWHPQT
ncbi:AAA family ATPase [Oryzicola mucosus]|uniref:AAA family ATPase n=1 Tax=Oryzicola mucosus TaxID=2767425 RepID=A0A8J6PWI9_9HYPH|nr:AAA family ATPase [Oryzicola mucosus]MBD0415493.1 AAA family ATPase [Oryzicola mucosus]